MSKQKKTTTSPDKCKHPATKLEYLDRNLTPHVSYPESNSIFQAIFLCKACGELVVKNADVSIPYLANGEIAPATKKIIGEVQAERKRIQEDLIKAQAKQQLQPGAAPAAPTN